MTVCKQPVATLALNATSTYVSMIRVWGGHLLFNAKRKVPRLSGGAQFLAFSLSQDLSSLHDFDDLSKSCRIGDGGTRPHTH